MQVNKKNTETVTNTIDKKLSIISPWTIEQVNKKETDGRSSHLQA